MIDLKKFCGTEETRPYLHNPFSRGDFTYATNGRIMVRVPRQDGVPDVEMPDGRKLDVEKPFHEAGPRPESMMPLHLKLPETTTEECEECEGRGFEHDCPDCECPCTECDGSGQAEKDISVSIRGAIFDAKYIRLIQSLPNARFVVVPSPEGPTWFAFDGGEGLLMPMRRPFDERIEEPEEAGASDAA